MKLAIIGSRNCPAIDIDVHLEEMPDVLISGGAEGVDTCVREYAKKKGIKLIEFYPNYAKYGKVAPLERNKQIVDECDSLIAFWDGTSRGTKYTIDYANKQGKPVKVIKLYQETADSKKLQAMKKAFLLAKAVEETK